MAPRSAESKEGERCAVPAPGRLPARSRPGVVSSTTSPSQEFHDLPETSGSRLLFSVEFLEAAGQLPAERGFNLSCENLLPRRGGVQRQGGYCLLTSTHPCACPSREGTLLKFSYSLVLHSSMDGSCEANSSTPAYGKSRFGRSGWVRASVAIIAIIA